jgi:hypothetical protein
MGEVGHTNRNNHGPRSNHLAVIEPQGKIIGEPLQSGAWRRRGRERFQKQNRLFIKQCPRIRFWDVGIAPAMRRQIQPISITRQVTAAFLTAER